MLVSVVLVMVGSLVDSVVEELVMVLRVELLGSLVSETERDLVEEVAVVFELVESVAVFP